MALPSRAPLLLAAEEAVTLLAPGCRGAVGRWLRGAEAALELSGPAGGAGRAGLSGAGQSAAKLDVSSEPDAAGTDSERQLVGRSRRPSSLWLLSVVLLGILWVAVWGAGNWLTWKRVGREAFPTTIGKLQVSGISSTVQIERDARGIPHVAAAEAGDAWAALGFVHAQDRLSQMLWLRRMARGRTAEVVGETGLRADRLARTLGIGRLADAQVARLEPDVAALLTSYSAGVNARIERVRAGLVGPPVDLAPRYLGLDAWKPGDSLAVVKLMAWASSPDVATGVVLEDLLERLGSVGARPFFPTGAGVPGVAIPFRAPPPEPVAAVAATSKPGQVSLRDVELQLSAWAVAADVTSSGAPLVAVDFHLRPTTPALLYESYLKAGDLDVAGVSVPGAPVFWAGRNRDVAWAASPARVVTADLYRESLRPPKPGHTGAGMFREGRKWRPIERRRERILISAANGSTREEVLEVHSTRHGPLVNGILGRDDALALRWTGMEPGDGFGGLLSVLYASSGAEVRKALVRHHEPVVAVLFADREGDVGMQMAGWLPRRVLPTGLLPVPGRKFGFDWRERLGYDGLPTLSLREADTGEADWLVVADNPLSDATAGGGIEWLWRTGEQGARIERELRGLTGGAPVELWGAAEVQRKLGASVPRQTLASVLALAGDPIKLDPEAREVREMLASWNGQIEPSSRAATVYAVFLQHFLFAHFAAVAGSERFERYLELAHTRPEALASAVLETAAGEGQPGGWAERGRVAANVRASLHNAGRSLAFRFGPDRNRWVWGDHYPIAFSRPGLPAWQRPHFEPLHPLAEPSGDEGAGRPTRLGFLRYRAHQPFAVHRVTTGRLLMDLSNRHQLLSVLAPGQSEHPGHPHFADGIDSWRAGRQRRLAMSPFLVAEATVERLVLSPRR